MLKAAWKLPSMETAGYVHSSGCGLLLAGSEGALQTVKFVYRNLKTANKHIEQTSTVNNSS